MRTLWKFACDFVDLVNKQPVWVRWPFWMFFILGMIQDYDSILTRWGVL